MPKLTLKKLRELHKKMEEMTTCPICKKEMEPVIMYTCEKHGITLEEKEVSMTKDNWEKRFDKKFKVDEQTRIGGKDIIRFVEEIRQFISKELRGKEGK